MKIFAALLIVIAIVVAAYFVVVYSGWRYVGADTGEAAFISRTMQTTALRSIRKHAASIKPVSVTDPEKLQDGFAEYHDTCEKCHGAPGTDGAQFAKYMDPAPPEPDDIVKQMKPAEIFWTAKHGVQMTGMPSFAKLDSDDTLWAVVAAIEQLPKMTPAQYRQRLNRLDTH